MKAIIEVDVPDYQIGQEVSIYFKDTMMKKGVVQEPKYCDRNICIQNEYNGIGCDECEVTKSQEPKTGHWDSRTCKCSECGYQIAFSEYAERKYKYCPNCGADMRGEQE